MRQSPILVDMMSLLADLLQETAGHVPIRSCLESFPPALTLQTINQRRGDALASQTGRNPAECTMILKAFANLRAFVKTDVGANTAWVTLQSVGERGIGVAQTIIFARVLGITGYGVYGLLFGTIGFVASVMGLQLGLTATVHVAQFRDTDKGKVASIISTISWLASGVALLIVVVVTPFAATISAFLFQSTLYRIEVILGAIFVAMTILTAIQDGIAQGFEIFRELAGIKVLTALIPLILAFPAAHFFGLTGIVTVILLGLMVKYFILWHVVKRKRREHAVPIQGPSYSPWPLIGNFAMPSMAVSLVVGFATWTGALLLSRQHHGFDSVAIVNTGLQWRSPIVLLVSALGAAAIPAFSRHLANGAHAHARKMRATLVSINGGIAGLASLLMIACSGWILGIYGPGFERGSLAFALVLLSTIPTAIAGVFMQELIGSARMWRQLWLHVPYVVALLVTFHRWVPSYGANGYGASLLVGGLVFMLTAVLADALNGREKRLEGCDWMTKTKTRD